jgi:dihydrolipoyl dehydrogenase
MYDVAIIGAGPAGIACAKEACKNGLRPLLIDKKETSFGGICLNRGCIPTKYFINSVKQGRNWQEALEDKDRIVRNIRSQGIQYLQKQGVAIIWGDAKFLDKNSLEVNGEAIVSKYIVIATGSKPKIIMDDPMVTVADELVRTQDLAQKYLIVGAGYIGIEMACLLRQYKKEVNVVEKENKILSGFDPYLANRLKIALQKKGIKIETSKDVKECDLSRYDKIISAVGRFPNTEGLNLKDTGISCDESGWIKTDEFMRTSVDNVYACGDVTGKYLLAYTAERQAAICMENIKRGPLVKENYEALPLCVFSIPSLASVGILGTEAKEKAIEHRIFQTNFLKFSSSYVYNDLDGFLQIVVNNEQQIIGAGIISQAAAEMIGLLTLCVQNKLKISDLQKLLLIHPTLSENISLFSQECN